MDGQRYKIRMIFVAALLLLQLAATTHVYSHDPGTAQGTACAACSIGDNLHAVTPASTAWQVPHLSQLIVTITAAAQYRSAATLTVRQRGPPNSP